MNIAPGKPVYYQQQGQDTKDPEFVEVCQFLLPDGRKARTYVKVGRKHAEMAKGMFLSMEVLRTKEIMLYARLEEQDEDDEESKLAKQMDAIGEKMQLLIELVAKNKGSKPTMEGTQNWCSGREGKGAPPGESCHGMEPEACGRCRQKGEEKPSLYLGDICNG
jgi:hypothetical protein